MTKNKAQVKVQGRNYTLIGTDSIEYMEAVAAYVNGKIEELSAASPRNMCDDRLMVLTAINLADELLKCREENTRLKQSLAEKS